ncbi:hypothetical protein DBV15_12096 [Temnothorax longispinosus]|uniref:C-Maf-inducing protein PH domain-containing protein n=1 Tax=Temnothorax longispinosus TaxID=300112 RepID=A0A4V3SCI9_9HYME|nr:hypothetical protein DBV15_12096 [Temnothorax longispinosus]
MNGRMKIIRFRVLCRRRRRSKTIRAAVGAANEGQQGNNTTATTISSPSPPPLSTTYRLWKTALASLKRKMTIRRSRLVRSLRRRTYFYRAAPRPRPSLAWTSSTVPYYDFMSVNGGAMRQGIIRTSSPQLSSDVSLHSSADCPLIFAAFTVRTAVRAWTRCEVQRVWTRLDAARSCPNLERQRWLLFGQQLVEPEIETGDVQVCYLNQIRTFLKKILCSKFFRRWETHYLFQRLLLVFQDADGFSSATCSVQLEQSEIRKYVVARWDPAYKNCLSIVLPDDLLLLQNAYTREQKISFEESDIQVCCLNQTRTFVKILSGKFLRRWETHHLYLNDCCLSSKTLTGFLQQSVPYSSTSEIRKYVVARWDPAYKNCLSIVLPDGSLLLQDSNAYTRDRKISFEESDIQVCCLNQTQTFVKKILSSKFLRR